MLPVNKIALGTTKLGMPYGAVEQQQVDQSLTAEIFQLCQQLELDMYDTAPSYGIAENLIGTHLCPNALSKHSETSQLASKVVTKVAKIESAKISKRDIQNVQSIFENSLKTMQLESCYGLLVHDVKDLFKEDARLLIEWLLRLKASGKVEKIGVSVYTPQEAETLLEFFDFDLIQLPCNIFDQRFLQAGTLDMLANRGVEIHARSLFLKGLILKPDTTAKLPDALLNHNSQFHDAMKQDNISAYDACLSFANKQSLIDRWVIGVSSKKQLKQLCDVPDVTFKNVAATTIDFDQWAFSDNASLDPRQW